MIFGWTPGIGDPTVYGWITVAAYFATAWLCFANGRVSRAPPGSGGRTILRWRARRRFWLALAVVLAVLGINKQLDIQTLFTDIGRTIAKSDGWYRERRGIQREFIGAVAIGGLIAVGAAMVLVRRAGGWALMATAGTVLIVLFVVIRAASFHHIDMILRGGWAGFRVNHALELGGIAIIAAAATGFARAARAERNLLRLESLAAAQRRHVQRSRRGEAGSGGPG